MGRAGRDELDAIRSAVDLPALVKKYAPARLRREGRQLRCRCPLREGQAPDDFAVDPDKRLWHCFGCLRGGDCFSFVEAWLALDFASAVRFLALEAVIARPSTGMVGTPAALSVRRGGLEKCV